MTRFALMAFYRILMMMMAWQRNAMALTLGVKIALLRALIMAN
jgi:hypothetical protein